MAQGTCCSCRRQRNLICLLWAGKVETTELVWSWLLKVADGQETELRGVAFRALAAADGAKFGRDLLARNGSWSTTRDYWENHYGTEALIKATAATPFDQLVSRLA